MPNSSHHPQSSRAHEARQRKATSHFADFLSTLLDSAFSIPGTTIRIGLDPLLGLIPGIGDYLSNLIGSSLLVLATRSGVPRIVIFRMAFNIVLNMLGGAIPGIGDLFSVWFKSNVRNAQLLHRYSQDPPPASTMFDWIYVITLISGIILIMTVLLFGILWLLTNLWKYVA
ncbi:MAG: hypothetical protein NPIRA02_12290 [Nitrospirales bacterium]|nr:MAG: hypothetical protein NPIRA02_12290 [Nitrospirales bacterium]